MSRRANPEQIHDARRAGIRYRLAGLGMSQYLADRWEQGIAHGAAFWAAGWAWIAEPRAARKVPAG